MKFEQKDLMDFLTTPDPILVLSRAAIPMAEAGLGFAYQAPGYELQETWRTKMTNAVQEEVSWLTLPERLLPETVFWSRLKLAELRLV